MQSLDRRLGESFFLGLNSEAARNMTLGELFDYQALEVKVMKITAGKVSLSIDIPEEITLICSELTDKRHGSDFPPHQPIQPGD